MSKTPEQVVSEAIESHWKTALNTHGPICASGTAFGVVSALRSAGWLRDEQHQINEWASRSLDAVQQTRELGEANISLIAQVARLTRERDEALASAGRWRSLSGRDYDAKLKAEAERDEARQGEKAVCDLWKYWQSTAEGAQGRLQEAQASAASPEVVRVADAVLTYKREAPAAFNLSDQHEWPWRGVVESAHALSASRQPKAQEPRYRVVECEPDANDEWSYGVTEQANDDIDDWIAAFDGPDAGARAEAECARLNGRQHEQDA